MLPICQYTYKQIIYKLKILTISPFSVYSSLTIQNLVNYFIFYKISQKKGSFTWALRNSECNNDYAFTRAMKTSIKSFSAPKSKLYPQNIQR